MRNFCLLSVPEHLSAFGPIVDGIVIAGDPHKQQHVTPTDQFDLLFGITRVEAPYIFTKQEEKMGIDVARRDRVLRTLVRNLFDYHQQVRS